MDAFVTPGFAKHSGMVSLLISLAAMFCGPAAHAELLAGVAPAASELATSWGGFSEADVSALEHASTAEATAARLAVLGSAAKVEPQSRNRPDAPLAAVASSDEELFPHSGRLMPLIVARPAAVPVMSPTGIRPGAVQPVGVSMSSLRSPTPSERAAR